MRNLVSYVLAPKRKQTETDNRLPLRRETSDDSEVSELPHDPELVELHEVGEHGVSSPTIFYRSESDCFQASPRPPSLTVDDEKSIAKKFNARAVGTTGVGAARRRPTSGAFNAITNEGDRSRDDGNLSRLHFANGGSDGEGTKQSRCLQL
jgi:hypothetical protein